MPFNRQFQVETVRASCGGAGGAIPTTSLFGGMNAVFSLGMAGPTISAGSLEISATTPTTNLATPSGLTYVGGAANVEVINNSLGIQQVNTPQGLANIVTNSPFSYQIQYYLPSQVGGLSGGVYTLTSNAFVTWTVANPAASTNTYNEIQITRTQGGTSQLYDYVYTNNSTNGSWTMDYPGGLREEQITCATNTNSMSGGSNGVEIITVISEVRVPGGSDQFKEMKTYQIPSAAVNNRGMTLLVQDTVSPDLNALTTTYAYNPNLRFYGNIPVPSLVVSPYGNWASYDYDSGSGQMTYQYAANLDVWTNASTGQKAFTYQYLNDFDDPLGENVTNYINVPRKTQLGIGGASAVEYTSYVNIVGNQRVDVTSMYNSGDPETVPSAGDHVTTTTYFTNGPNAGQAASIVRPDGTMTIYAQAVAANGTQTNFTWNGAPNSGQTAIVDGTETISIIGPVGQRISMMQIDIASSIVLANDVYGNYDSLDRPQLVTHLDGTTEQTYYGCCGIDESVDRDGVTNFYYYDAANRQVATLRNGIVTSNVLDSVGRTLATIRIGTNGASMVTGQWKYDAAGRTVAYTNALGGVTTYAESADPTTGGKIVTTTNPDLSTIVEYYYLDGTLKKRTGTAVRGVRYTNYYNMGNSYGGWMATEIKLNASGSDTTEVVTNIYNSFGQNYETLYADGSASYNTYNSLGQLAVSVDADEVATAFGYNAKGEQTSVTVDPTNFNRVTYTINDVIFDSSHGTNVNRTRVFLSTASNLVSISETATTGLASWQTQYRDAVTPVTSESQTSYAATRTETSTAPDNSYSVSVYSNGVLMSVTSKDSGGNQISKTTYAYDAYGRQSAVTDARNGSTIYIYNNADTVVSMTSPNPGSVGGAPQTTTSYFNAMMQPTNVVQPDGTSIISSYLTTGELAQTSGSRTYPVGYSYDYAGRMRTMTNWSNFSTGTGARVTTWNYDANRGWLDSKADASNNAVAYTYTPAGRLASRTWARGTNTSYGYDTAGGLSTVSYNDGTTAGFTNTYDSLGRVSSVYCGTMTTSFAYDWANDVLSESYSGGVLGGLKLTNQYDTCLRRTNMALMNGSSSLCQTLYTYDNASRLLTVSDGTNKATYTYVANSSLPGQIVFSQNGTTRMTTTKQYDYLNRLTSISSTPSNAFNYLYNAANQRTTARLADSSYWRYQYDSLGQVTSGVKYWADETPVAGQQFDYTFDTIGNRTQTQSGGDQNGLNLRVANYTNNVLNQITSRGAPAFVDIMGNGLATNPVTVNGTTAYRKSEYFREQLGVTNSSAPVWDSVTVAATGQGSVTGHLFVPQNPETFTYDLDGNLLTDGRWAYTWNGENRLIGMTSLTNAPAGSQLQLVFAYDYQGRRIQKIVSTNSGIAYIGEYTNIFPYDGWNCIATLSPSLGLINSFMWGSDLSGSLQGAGGVGGLVKVAYLGTSATNCLVAFDGNGNVNALVNAADGTVAATYEYGPFGEVIRASGPMAKANPFRFSTKYDDDESDLVYYGYRYYNPSEGKWLSKDPIDEPGFQLLDQGSTAESSDEDDSGDLNLYSFVANSPIAHVDGTGLESITFDSVWFQDQCGGWQQAWNINTGMKGGEGSFWIVQKVTVTFGYTGCGQNGANGTVVWWEAVEGTVGVNLVVQDKDAAPNHPHSFGKQQIDVQSAIYYPGKASKDIKTWVWTGPPQYRQAGMYQTGPPGPSWWGKNTHGTASRSSWSSWNCCCDATEPVFGHSP